MLVLLVQLLQMVVRSTKVLPVLLAWLRLCCLFMLLKVIEPCMGMVFMYVSRRGRTFSLRRFIIVCGNLAMLYVEIELK